MNRDFQEARAYAEHLLSEHRRVHGLLNRIEQQWSLAPSGPHQSGAIAELRAGVEELRGELARHFAEEEQGGVLEEAVARCPDLGREETRLEDEHAAILGEIDRIIAGMRAASEVGLLPKHLKEGFKRFVDALKGHEAGENRLLEQGFGMEIE